MSAACVGIGRGASGCYCFDAFYEYADRLSPLGNAPAEACADYVVSLFSDLTRYVTMQNLMHDDGFSTTGISEEIVELITTAKQ
nr:SDR family oxidoreductase [Hymenobacter sp. CCM 8763]